MAGNADSDDFSRWGASRPLRENAGEVTRRPRPSDLTTPPISHDPPPPTARKIGGARNFLQKAAHDRQSGHWRDYQRYIIETTTFETPSDPTPAPIDGDVPSGDVTKNAKQRGHPEQQATVFSIDSKFTQRTMQDGGDGAYLNGRDHQANAEWRRYWGTLTHGQRRDWAELPDLKVSASCYVCEETRVQCFVRKTKNDDLEVACQGCDLLSRPCIFTTSHRHQSNEERGAKATTEYSKRAFAQNGQTVQRALEMIWRTAIAQQRETYLDFMEICTTPGAVEHRQYKPELLVLHEHHQLMDNVPLPPGVSQAYPPLPANMPIPPMIGSASHNAHHQGRDGEFSTWQFGKVERCFNPRLQRWETVLTFAASESLHRAATTLRKGDLDYHEVFAAMWNRPAAHDSPSVPQGLLLYAAATRPSSYFRWCPCRAPDKQICGFYLLENAGPQLYNIAWLGPGDVDPGYLIHARSREVFCFKPEISRHAPSALSHLVNIREG